MKEGRIPLRTPKGFPRWGFLRLRHPEPKYTYGSGRVFTVDYPLLRTPWFGVLLRKIVAQDDHAGMHNHGFDMTTLILRGGYTEQRDRAPHVRKHHPGHLNRFEGEECHRIVRLYRHPTWTLALHKKWKGYARAGYRTDNGFVPFR